MEARLEDEMAEFNAQDIKKMEKKDARSRKKD